MTKQENHELSDREIEILRLVATGASNKEIAQKLFISPNTVKVHLRNIFEKIGAASRTEAAMYAVKEGITKGGDIFDDNLLPGTEIIHDFNPSGQSKLSRSTNFKTVQFFRFVMISVGILIFLIITYLTLIGFISSSSFSNVIVETSEIPEMELKNWNKLADIPTPRIGMATVTHFSELYTFGGLDGGYVSDKVEKYDSIKNEWTNAAPMPLAVSDIKAVINETKIIIPGGTTSTGFPTDRMQIFDIQSNTWDQGKKLPQPITGYGMVTWNENVYLFGGWNGKEFLDTVYQYNLVSDEWTFITYMPMKRAYLEVILINDTSYIIGGQNIDKNPINIIIPMVFFTGDKTSINPGNFISMPFTLSKLQATSLAEIIYILGNEVNSDSGKTGLRGLQFFPYNQTWGEFESVPFLDLEEPVIVGLDTDIHILSGKINGNISSDHWSYKALNVIFLPIID
jgi:DNA-binding CsgD family transcriptional regulator